MKETGSNNDLKNQITTLISWINSFRKRYHIQTSMTLGVLASITFIAAEIVPEIQKYIQISGIMQYIILIVLLDLAVSVYAIQIPPTIRIAMNQDESMTILIGALTRCRTDGVDLLEYAGFTTLPLIRAIRREGISMRMLVKHPETIDGIQRQRNITTLDTIYNSIFEDYNGSIEIRCYKLPYSLRGRRLGKVLLELGWLTPDVKRQTVFGHSNPSNIVDLSDSKNEHLRIFFDKTFKALWDDANTEDGRAVLQRLRTSA